MTRALVVHHDIDLADIEVEDLRRAGYEVDQCAGPEGGGCPVLHGEPCWQVEKADVLVYDVLAAGDSGHKLVEELRALHPNKPVVLTSGGLLLDWVETEGPNEVTPALGAPDQSILTAAVEAAIRRGVAAPPEPAAEPRRIPRW
jgi:DNA-binding NtrC family response regulator